jgi:hypothetical protein
VILELRVKQLANSNWQLAKPSSGAFKKLIHIPPCVLSQAELTMHLNYSGKFSLNFSL